MKDFICGNCGYEGRPETITKGSILIELALWLFLIIPGVIYSIWRLTSRYKACPKCGAANMLPADAPRARKLVMEMRGK